MAYPYYTGQMQAGAQPVAGPIVYGYPQQPQGQLEQLRAAQAYQAPPMMQAQPQAAQNAGAGISWVQGEAGAKAFLVAPGNSVLLMDSEGQSFYIKSADNSGMPLPLRIFDYTERQTGQVIPPAAQAAQMPSAEYATREELALLSRRLEELEHMKAVPSAKTEEAERPAVEKGVSHGKRTV